MAGTMADYLPTRAPDVSAALTLSPSAVRLEQGDVPVRINEGDDGSIEAVSLADTPSFVVELAWEHITQAEASEIVDMYCNMSKAFGQTRTFLWTHPYDGVTYVVRFADKLGRQYYGQLQRVPPLRLRVEGVAA